MDVTPLGLGGVVILTPRRFADERGFFEETWNERAMADAGLHVAFVQDNQSLSHERGTVRGLHFQAPPFEQAKLVRVARGAIVDVVVDLRRSSPTYGRWVRAELTEQNGAQLFVPRGFAHGFATLTEDSLVCYKVDGFYDRASEGGIRFDDQDLAVDWGIAPAEAVLSAKDATLPMFRGLPPIFG